MESEKQKIIILELFSGYGSTTFALTKAGIEHKVIGYSDIEKCANYIYELNHGKDIPQLGDITKIDPNDLEDFDLLTGGFPCTDVSICGLRDLSRGKTILFFEIIRIAEVKRPKFLLLENVQGLLSHDNGKTMQVVLDELKCIGYHVKWELLYSKDHGTPQNRPRVWFACFRDKEDADKFMFPETEPLMITVKDLLEDEVDEKYYLNENQLKKIEEYNIKNKQKGRGFRLEPTEDVSKTITQHIHKDINDVPFIADYRYDEGLRPRKDGISPTLAARKRENDLSGCPIINTITTGYGRQGRNKQINKITNRWRRLSPRECFRLQGFFEDQIKFGDLSDSKLYFLAGNGWDINVASKIFIQMFKGNQNKQRGLLDF